MLNTNSQQLFSSDSYIIGHMCFEQYSIFVECFSFTRYHQPSFRLWSESLRLLFSHFYFIFNKNNISFMIRFPKSRDSYFICCSSQFLFMFSVFIDEDCGCSTRIHEMIDFMYVPWHFHLSTKFLRMNSMPFSRRKRNILK